MFSLSKEISAILGLATPQDEVVVRLDNHGGLVHEHGLAASQLIRLLDRDIPQPQGVAILHNDYKLDNTMVSAEGDVVAVFDWEICTLGDRFELPVVVQNQTDDPLTVDVAVRAANAVLTEGAGQQVIVPANDRLEVRFPATTDRAGTARFQIAATAGRWADAPIFEDFEP